jgi:hypothetical protein
MISREFEGCCKGVARALQGWFKGGLKWCWQKTRCEKLIPWCSRYMCHWSHSRKTPLHEDTVRSTARPHPPPHALPGPTMPQKLYFDFFFMERGRTLSSPFAYHFKHSRFDGKHFVGAPSQQALHSADQARVLGHLVQHALVLSSLDTLQEQAPWHNGGTCGSQWQSAIQGVSNCRAHAGTVNSPSTRQRREPSHGCRGALI